MARPRRWPTTSSAGSRASRSERGGTGTIERFVKWARRRKSAAAPVASSPWRSVAVVVTIGVKNIEVTRRKKETEHALEKYKTALHDQQLALEIAQQTSYYQTIALAAPEVMANNVRRADQLLDTCPRELRHWEWSALKRLCHGESLLMASPRSPPPRPSAPTAAWWRRPAAHWASRGFVTIWDADTGREVRSFRGHDDAITGLAFSPAGDRLATRAATVRSGSGTRRPAGRPSFSAATSQGVSLRGVQPGRAMIASGGRGPNDQDSGMRPRGPS